MTHRTASCSCGQLQAQVRADPIRVSVCHCLACQRRTGSVFGARAHCAASAVRVTGIGQEFVRVGDAGSCATFRFCQVCGATVYDTSDGMDGFVVPPVGVFADPQCPAPVFSVDEERMHGWVTLPDGMEHLA